LARPKMPREARTDFGMTNLPTESTEHVFDFMVNK